MSASAKIETSETFPRIEAVRDYLTAQSFTPVTDRDELKRIMATARQINLDEGVRQDDESDALDALFVELGVPPGTLMNEATDLYLKSRYGRYYG